MQPVPVVILNYNGERLLADCLDSLRAQDYPGTEVWVVDSGSTDASLSLVRDKYPWVKVIPLGRNYGVAKGYNLGLGEILKDERIQYFATLNNDTKLSPGWLSALVDVMERHPEAGTVTSKTVFFYEPNKIDTTGVLLYRDGSNQGRGHLEIDRGQFEEEEEVFGASLVAALIRRKAWEDAGGFENIFFAYNEEVDLNWRMRLRGWKSYYTPKAVAYHVHSAHFVSYSTAKVYFTERNRIWHVIRNFPLPLLVRSPYYTAVRYWTLARGMARKRGAAAKVAERTSKATIAITLVRAWGAGLALAPLFLVKRVINQRRRKVSWREVEEWHRRYGVDVETLTLMNRDRLDHARPDELLPGPDPGAAPGQ
jgi:GT2 family glycosyltransferase